MHLCGIDIGTTSICAVVIDQKTGRLIKHRTVNSEAFIDSSRPFEKIQDPRKIISLAKALLDEVLTDEIVSIGVSGQMHGIVYLDAQGEAVSPLYTWQDKRGDEPYLDSTYASYLGSYAGYGNVSDFYNRENGIRPREAVTYATVHDYLVMKLCGKKTPLLHVTNAASLGLFDEKTLTFRYDYAPEITADDTVAGYYRGIPVSVAIGDNQASVLSTLTDDDALLLNFGTGSQISLVSDRPITAENIESRPYFDHQYLLVGSALCGGRAYSLLCDFYHALLSEHTPLSRDAVYLIMERMLCEGSEQVLCVDTRFAGTRAHSDQTGSITGITTENFTPAALTRGVLVGMVEELYGMYLEMGCVRTHAVASGNGIRKNPHLKKIAGERFAMPVKMPEHLEEAAYGAALFGAIAAGYFCSIKEAQSLIRFQ